jgi:hypothetical protein
MFGFQTNLENLKNMVFEDVFFEKSYNFKLIKIAFLKKVHTRSLSIVTPTKDIYNINPK